MLRAFLTLLCLVSAIGLAETCQELNLKITDESAALEKLVEQEQELEKKFEKSLVADLTAQSDGYLGEVHRNSVVKVAFAKKRLKKAIDLRRSGLNSITADFCAKCGTSAKNESAKRVYCEKCPSGPGCSAP